jgi:hypothetical protein
VSPLRDKVKFGHIGELEVCAKIDGNIVAVKNVFVIK